MPKEECIFCKIARKEIKEEIVYESDNFIAFPDANPKCKGHTLIIPKKHFTNIIEMPSLLGNELIDVIKKVAARRLEEGADGFNILVNTGKGAGQIVMHVHIHLLPRNKNCKVDF
jgi:histidine triad (HIT) family protein